MGDPRDSIDDINPGRVPCGAIDVETKLGLMHIDTYDLEAAKRYKAERAHRAANPDASPRSDQNAQHSG
jgi:hypothetical protein